MRDESDFKGFLVKAQNCIDGLERQRDRLKERVAHLESENTLLLNRIAGLENRTVSETDIEAMGYMKLPVDRNRVPIRPGDAVFLCDGSAVSVRCVSDENEFTFRDDDGNMSWESDADTCTHESPHHYPLDADGVECHAGDTVWDLAGGAECEVTGAQEYGECIRLISKERRCEIAMPARCFSHKRPDSWEMLEDDAEKLRKDIALNLGDWSPSDFKSDGDSIQDRVLGIVRRARALAEVDAE